MRTRSCRRANFWPSSRPTRCHLADALTQPAAPRTTSDGAAPAPPLAGNTSSAWGNWLAVALRVGLVVAAGGVTWTVAADWDRWSGSRRVQWTDDAFVAGDVIPLSTKVSGYVATVAVQDFERVKQGQVLAELEPSDYRAQLAQADANLQAAAATLADLVNLRTIKRALIRQAQAQVEATAADVTRTHLEANRQRTLLTSNVAGTKQAVERAEADEKRFVAQFILNAAALDQQKALLTGLDNRERELIAQRDAADAQLQLAQNNFGYTRIRSPVDGMAGQRQVRPGQFVGVGTPIVTVMQLANVWVIAYFRETQMTQIRVGQPARITVDAFPDLVLTGHVDGWSPGTGSTFALLAPDNATGNFTKVAQRLPVKIVLDAGQDVAQLIRPGMSVEAAIDTGTGER